MAEVEIKAKTKVGDEWHEASAMVDFGEDLEDAITKFGESVVFSKYVAEAKIDAQAAIRRYIDAGKNPDEIAALMKEWKPGVTVKRAKDPTAAFKAKFAAMTPEEQAKAIQELKDSLK